MEQVELGDIDQLHLQTLCLHLYCSSRSVQCLIVEPFLFSMVMSVQLEH